MFENNLSPILLELGPLTIRWYGVLFATGILLNYFYTRWIFRREGLALADLESVVTYLAIGMIVGARLGHVLFYNLDYFWAHPLDILKIWEGGLASHGAAIGVLIAYFLWIRNYKKSFYSYADVLVLGMPLTATFVRIGNFFNSEIIGRPTDGSWGVIFRRLGEDFPRYPTQLFEAGLNLAIFVVLFLVYRKYYRRLKKLTLLFLYVFLYFSTRFLVEFWKERHGIQDSLPLSKGQLLSILPALIAAGWFLFRGAGKKKQAEEDEML